MTPSLGFNKPESANFIFECMQYLMPEEGGKKYTSCYGFFFMPVQSLLQRQSPAMFRHLYSFFNLKETTLKKKNSTLNKT